MSSVIEPPAEVLAAYGASDARITPVTVGLINVTFRVETESETLTLQQVNPMFPAAINEDIDNATRALAARGVRTPTIRRSSNGATCVQHGAAVWRALTWVDGVVHERLGDPGQAREAGAVLGRFHAALAEWDEPLTCARPGVHDTDMHLSVLRTAMTEHATHERAEVVTPLAEEILAESERLPRLPELPMRVVHGDPKITNLVFDADDRGVCLIDFDCLSRMVLPHELGDALRSWSNRAGEDESQARLDPRYVEGALRGYAAATQDYVTEAEWRHFVAGFRIISLELAARFCADALNESYFGWNAQRYASASHHNETRARGQLSLSRQVHAATDELEHLAERIFYRPENRQGS